MKLFALDLGNKQTKIKSCRKVKVLPSRFVEASRYGDRDLLGFAKAKKDIRDFVSSKDEDFTYVWGTELDEGSVGMSADTIGLSAERYFRHDFKLLVDFALAELALDFPEAEKSLLEVAVVTGVPTADYIQESALKALEKAIKGDHNVTVDGKVLNIRVKKLFVLPQPIGTVINVVTDEKGNLIDTPLLNAYIGVVDVGGGTILIDALNKMNMEQAKRRQLSEGAYTLYQAIVKELTTEGHSVNEYEIERILRAGNATEQYSWSPNGRNKIDITSTVMKERRKFTRNTARAITSTYGGFAKMQTVLVTGGAAILLVKKVFNEEVTIAQYMDNSELANISGFYKYGLMEGIEQQHEQSTTI